MNIKIYNIKLWRIYIFLYKFNSPYYNIENKYMDYKFLILIVLCLILFYIYHQIEDIKSEILHLHNKTDNLSELEKFVDLHNKQTFVGDINETIKEIKQNTVTNDTNKAQVGTSEKELIESDRSTSVSLTISSISANEKVEQQFSNDNDNTVNDECNVEIDDVINLIQKNHHNKLVEELNNTFKVEDEYKVSLKVNNEDGLVAPPTSLEEDFSNDNKKYNISKLRKLRLEQLQDIASKLQLQILTEVNGKSKPKTKKQLCEEIVSN